MSSSVTYHIQDEYIGILTLNRPEVMNAMSLELLETLNNILQNIEKDNQIRVLIITAAGERAFSAGADLKERKEMSEQKVRNTVTFIGDTINKIAEIDIPVIAAMNGAAIGGGLELALACDIRIASQDVKMGLTETSLAIIPGAGGTQRLSRLVGMGQAKRLIFTAAIIKADEAMSIGLIEQVVPTAKLMEYAIHMANKIAQNGPIGVMQAKIAINKGIEVDLHSGLQIEKLCYEKTIHTNDRKEGLEAFRAKRKPKYMGD